MGLAVALASGPAAAELTVRPNELAPASLDVLVGKQALVERMRILDVLGGSKDGPSDARPEGHARTVLGWGSGKRQSRIKKA